MDVYLQQCANLNAVDKIDIEVYTKLFELDSKLGTTASEQLRRCLQNTIRSDIIKVLF